MKNTLACLMIATLLLAACGDKNAGSAAIKAQYAAAKPSAPTASDLSGAPKRDYWQPVAAYLAGSYSSDCMRLPGTVRARATLVIAADGSYSVGGVADSLLKSELTVLSHTRNPAASDGLLVNASSPATVLSMMNGELGRGSAMTFHQGGLRLSCDESQDPIGLTGKELYALYAGVLEVAPAKIMCTSAAQAQPSELRYELKKGVLAVNGQTFKLAAMDEMVSLENGFAALTYQASSEEEERGVTINVDTTGKIRKVLTFGKDGPSLSCGQ